MKVISLKQKAIIWAGDLRCWATVRFWRRT